MIKLQITGNIGSDATVRQVGTSSAISFPVASTKFWRDKEGEKKEETTWVDCTIWVRNNGNTDFSKNIKKGLRIFCTGEPSTQIYNNKASLKLDVDQFELQTWEPKN